MAVVTDTVDELFPHREIAEFIAEGLASDDPVVVISTPETRRSIEAHLIAFGIEPVDLESDGRGWWFDADQLLARILVGGLPDETEFEKAMKEILFNGVSASPARRIRTYHELVDVLRHRESLEAAVLLLRLWNDLCARYEELLLAYTVAELYRQKDCTG